MLPPCPHGPSKTFKQKYNAKEYFMTEEKQEEKKVVKKKVAKKKPVEVKGHMVYLGVCTKTGKKLYKEI